MQLREIMTRKVEVVPPGAKLAEAARKMKTLDVGAVPVCDGERLCGMITDRDIAIRAVAEGRDPTKTAVREAMSSDLVYCFEDEEYEEAAALMKKRQIRRLPILSREKRLVAILSLGDVSVRGDDDGLTAETVEAVSAPARAH